MNGAGALGSAPDTPFSISPFTNPMGPNKLWTRAKWVVVQYSWSNFLPSSLGYKTETLIIFPAPGSLVDFGFVCAVIRRCAQCTRHVDRWQRHVDGTFVQARGPGAF